MKSLNSFCTYVIYDLSGELLYVGSGNINRPFSKTRTSKELENLIRGGKTVSKIIKQEISLDEAQELENLIYNEAKNVGLCKHNLMEPFIFSELTYEFCSEWFYIDETSDSLLRWNKDVIKTTGKLLNKKYTLSGYRKGDAVKLSSKSSRYHRVSVENKSLLQHRIIFVLANKINLPTGLVIDHIDGNKLNNHWSNLRPLSSGHNSMHGGLMKTPSSNTGIKGVTWHISANTYLVHWKENGKAKTKSFNPKNYGSHELAICAAKEFRNMKEIDYRQKVEQTEKLYTELLSEL